MLHKKDTECPKQVKIRGEFKPNAWAQSLIYFQKTRITGQQICSILPFVV